MTVFANTFIMSFYVLHCHRLIYRGNEGSSVSLRGSYQQELSNYREEEKRLNIETKWSPLYT